MSWPPTAASAGRLNSRAVAPACADGGVSTMHGELGAAQGCTSWSLIYRWSRHSHTSVFVVAIVSAVCIQGCHVTK